MPSYSSYHGPVTRDFRENPIHESHHVPEMHQIAKDEINSLVPDMIRRECVEYINNAIDAMIGAVEYDVNTSLEISFSDLGDMYKDKRVKKFVSDAICKSIKKRLNSLKIEIK